MSSDTGTIAAAAPPPSGRTEVAGLTTLSLDQHGNYHDNVNDDGPNVVAADDEIYGMRLPFRMSKASTSMWLRQNKFVLAVSVVAAVVLVMMITLIGANPTEKQALNKAGKGDQAEEVADPWVRERAYGFNCSTSLHENYFDASFIANAKFIRKRCTVPKKDIGTCLCPDPTAPAPKASSKPYDFTRQRNVLLLDPFLKQNNNNETEAGAEPAATLDVLFYGDSVIEHMLGTHNGVTQDLWKDAHNAFLEYFDVDPFPDSAAAANNESETTTAAAVVVPDNRLRGIAMGNDDGSMQMLYRMQNGEFPAELDVPVIWLFTGTTEYINLMCTDEAVVAGNIAIVQDILQQRANHSTTVPRIVINSLLPMENQTLAARVQRINDLLRCYAEQTEHVEFFDATVWLGKYPATPDHPNGKLFRDPIQPNGAGYREWIPAMAKRVQKILSGQPEDGGR